MFNAKARWDRRIAASSRPDPDSLDERIEVLAYFKGGRIYPRLFILKGKEYQIKEVTYSWQERCGGQTLNCFSVSTGPDLYQISFNNATYGWRLDKVLQ
ncbi:hypothetical protein ACFLZ3_02940 [Candidatus Omnitrophota bacterium]